MLAYLFALSCICASLECNTCDCNVYISQEYVKTSTIADLKNIALDNKLVWVEDLNNQM